MLSNDNVLTYFRCSDNLKAAMGFSDILSIVSSDIQHVEDELESNIQSPIPLVYERIYAAAALELIHTATLLHDDVVDDAKLRRGKPSSNIVWGNKPTVLVGDFMLARALGLIQACGDLDLIKAVTDAAAKLAEGQVLEVMNANNMLHCLKAADL